MGRYEITLTICPKKLECCALVLGTDLPLVVRGGAQSVGSFLGSLPGRILQELQQEMAEGLGYEEYSLEVFPCEKE